MATDSAQVRVKCERLLKHRRLRFLAGSVLLTIGLCVYMFVLCPWPKYVDEHSAHTLFISLTYEGRTGNQLFKYASLLGIANRTGRRPVVPPSFPLLELFELSHVQDVDTRCWAYVREDLSAGFDTNLFHLPLTNVNVAEYLQSWKYFNHIQQTIRTEFTFKRDIQAAAEHMFQKYTNSVPKSSVVGIHVRRGDHLTDNFKNLGYTMADLEYFKRSMTYMRSKIQNATFIVVGDDLPWAKDNFKFGDTVVAEDASPGVHLALLSLCDHVIQSTGTFSWWAGWFVPGHVVYYKNYPAPGSWLEERTIRADHFPTHWVAL